MFINSMVADGDRLYASDNNFGIPSLLLDLQPEKSILLPVCLWGHKGKFSEPVKTYLFYTYDNVFNGLINNFKKIVLSGCEEVSELNFTINDMTPMAIAIERTYQKRWISRSLQECGIKVWVDLNVSPRYAELNLIGIPSGYNAFITRGYANRIGDLNYEYTLAQRISQKENPNFVVYGGGRAAQNFCIEHKAVYIPDFMTERHKIIVQKKGGKNE
ncbi:MAG: DUF4417 domain-containing protein [Candidatus Limisoma sp.]